MLLVYCYSVAEWRRGDAIAPEAAALPSIPEKLADILQERRLARAATPGDFVRINNWAILSRPLQKTVMDNLTASWRN